MADMPPIIYDPADLAAIRAAREQLYLTQAARRRKYLLLGPPGAARTKDISEVTVARGNLDDARATAREGAQHADV